MPSVISALIRSPAPNSHRSRRFFYRRLTASVVLLTVGAAIAVPSLLVGARGESNLGNLRTTEPAAPSLRVGSTRKPRQEGLTSGGSFNGDLLDLSSSKSAKWMRPEHKEQINPAASAAAGGQSTQAQSVTVLTRQNSPDIPQCREIVTDEILDLVNSASEDPAEVFERNRREHPHMIMMPPPLDCASKLWVAARRSNRASPPVIYPESLALRQNPIEKFFNLAALNASVGTNNNPAGGLPDYQGTGSISIDPNNSLHLIASSNTFYKDPTATCQSPTGGTANTYGTIALFGSTDGGATWTYNCAPWPATITGGVTGATFWFGSYPTLAWDNQGRAYATYMLLSQSASAYGAAIVVARTSDNGASWQSLGTVVNGIASTTQGNDKEMMAIDNSLGQTFSHSGRLYVIWQAANAEKIAFSDTGTAWTTVNFPSNTGAGGGNVVVGADGTVYVIWSRYNVETIVFSKSTDGGATWTAPQIIATLALQSYGTNNKPPAQDKRGINGFGAIDVDRNPASAFFGNLYVSFTDFPSGTTTGADTNSYVIRSTNGGASWSSRVKVNDDNFGATQMFPWLAVDQSDGTVNVSWYDTRLDPLNRKTQMVSSRSVDGGASFEPNVLVSDGGSAWRNNVNYSDENSTDNPAFNSNQYGDYSGLAALNRQVHPLWTDSRMSFPVADTESPSRKEDNGTATITYCSAPMAIVSPAVNSSTAPSVAVSWSAPGWGANATNGTYSVFRNTVAIFPSGSPLASDLTSTNYVDITGESGTTYYYFVRAKNNCTGTALTPMSTDSPASAGVDFGSAGTPTGTLQGTVSAGSSLVSGVVVTAGTLSATTNASGFYLFAAIDAATYAVSASPSGYNPVSVNGVVVTGTTTSVQNLALTPVTSGSCYTDTTYVDFSPGAGSNVDLAGTPGSIKLTDLGFERSDQISSPAALSTSNNLSATTWTGQTFRAGVTGSLKKIDVGLGLASGTSGTITVEIRNLNGINPGTTVLATTTIGPVTNVGSALLYTTTFATPAAVVSGTSYSVVLKTSVGSTVFGVRGSTAGGSSLANGQVFTTTNSGTTWTAVAADLNFTTYVTPPTTYPVSGNLSSGVKDANSVVGLVPRWLTLSWNATSPANTTVQFQAAASNNINGPFNFVGPDGTASTFFTTSGALLSQFNGFRYLKYEAFLSTTDNVITPALSDVTICFDNDTPLIAAATSLSIQQASASNAQIATASDPGQAATTLTVTGALLTGDGVSINNISVDVEGRVTADVAASCTATNSTFTLTVTNGSSATATATLTVNVTASPTPMITPGGPTTFCEGGSVTLTSSSASGNQWYLDSNPIAGETNQNVVASAAGNYTTIVTINECASASSSATAVTVNPTPATPTITPDGPTTFCAGGSVTLTSSSASGNQWSLNGNPIGGETNQTFVANAAGNYTDTVTAEGCASASSAATTVTVNPIPATPTITPDGPTTFCAGGSVTLTSSSASGNQWHLNGNPIGGATNQTYVATAAGSYTDTVTDLSCSGSPSSATTVTVNPIPSTPTITPDGPTTFCEGGSVTLTSSGVSGNQWYLNGNLIGGATNQNYVVTTAGNYTDTVMSEGCVSAPSAATTVTVNPIPVTPTITPSGPTTFCEGGSVTLTSSSTTGNQWHLNGNPIGGATNQNYVATTAGNYTDTVTAEGCASAPSAATAVTVNPTPVTPTITPDGPTTFCEGSSVTLTSSSASGNQWYLGGNPIGGATNQTYVATTAGNYTDTVTADSCPSAPSAATTVTVNPSRVTPTITADGPTTFCEGSSVTLTSSSASGNQWHLNGNPIGGATNQAFIATGTGDYTNVVTTSGCDSAPSAATTVTVKPTPATPTISASGPTTFCEGSSVTLTSSGASGNQWLLNGNPIAGATNQSYVVTASGNYTDIVTSDGCDSASSAPLAVTLTNGAPLVTTNTDSGAGSLRQAILDACDGSTITFDPGLSGQTITLTTGELAINRSITIQGPGADLLTVRRSIAPGTPLFSLFANQQNVVANISGLTLTNADTAQNGGAIRNSGTLTLSGLTLSNNHTTAGGSAIFNDRNGNITLSNSTLSGNSAGFAAIYNESDTMTIANSTFTANTNQGGAPGAAIFSESNSTTNVTNCTISQNTGQGGAVFQNRGGAGIVNLKNSIVTGNTGGDVSGIADGGNNLIGGSALLAPLGNYGGPTQTMALLPGSAGIDVGTNNGASATDQRGIDRFGAVDIGAYESSGFTIAVTSGSAQSAQILSAFGSPLVATVTSVFSEPVAGGAVTFTAPTSGASGIFSGSVTPVVIEAGGLATSSTFTANDIAGGPYSVVAGIGTGLPTASFALINSKGNQTIAFGGLEPKSFGNEDFLLSASATSGLEVSFSATGSCTVSGVTVHLTGGGSCTITAAQVGDSNYNAAANVPQGFSIGKSDQTVTFGSLTNKNFKDADFSVSASASSRLAVRFAATGNCTVTGTTVHLKDVGSCTVTALQVGDSNYNAAPEVPQSFSIGRSNQTITFAALGDKTFGDLDFAVSGTSDSGLALSFAGSGQCTVSGSVVHIVSAGSCVVTASQAGDDTYTAAIDVAQSFTIANRALVTISQSNFNVSETSGVVTITVNRTGDLSIPVSVDYQTDDTGSSDVCSTLNSGMASSRCDIGVTLGTLTFAVNESQQTFTIPITQDSFTEGPELFTVNLSNLRGNGAALMVPSSATITITDSPEPAPNANDDADTFVRQQYRDFLNRDADPAGLAFWAGEINSCGNDASCRENKRINVSAAFFLSIEFQATGNLVRSFYVAALNRPATNNMPEFSEFERDTQAMQTGVIVGQENWQQTLKDNRDAFMRVFVTRAEFVGLYPTTDMPGQYVDKLYLHAGVTPTSSERNDAMLEFGSATTAADAGARGRTLLRVTDHAEFRHREMNGSFVQMEYFGYLRRNPNASPDGNFDGYNFWVNKLNAFGGNYISSEMVKAFITSGEYRGRFGPN